MWIKVADTLSPKINHGDTIQVHKLIYMVDDQTFKIAFDSACLRRSLFLCVFHRILHSNTVQKINNQYIFDERLTISTSCSIILEREKLPCLMIHHMPEDWHHHLSDLSSEPTNLPYTKTLKTLQSHSWAYVHKTVIWKDTCTSMLISALFIIARI